MPKNKSMQALNGKKTPDRSLGLLIHRENQTWFQVRKLKHGTGLE